MSIKLLYLQLFKYTFSMFTSEVFYVRAIRVSECMLNAAEELDSNRPGIIDNSKSQIISFSPSYSMRIENNEVLLFSSFTRFIVWISKEAYDFLMEHQNETEESVISSIRDDESAQIIKKFFDELNHYGVLSAA